MELKDKVVVITGASKGLGRELAQTFTKEGAKVVISARSEKELQEVAEELGALAIAADVTKENDVESLARDVVREYGRIDIWINNAGAWIPHGPIEELDMKRVHDMMEVNLFGTMYGSRVALIQMRKQNGGMIINILSTSALEGRSGSSGYCASKYAAVGFTKSLRKETKDSGITVISIYPGGMQTNLFDEEKPEDIDKYMQPSFVVERIVQNLQQREPKEELIIRRPSK
ncbi:MAG TPA: SDR family oxidoreductase [Candidatus Jorgensenbacteria bacterium]|uniref:Uncharacterized protein n=1 Tax=marine sediment metagenome TaxID=412755 RepID=A0A0F9HWE5_9ZZZZ|nr:SDR family oxidoreductase [Candidatus Jorgensenbacteria bacterium]